MLSLLATLALASSVSSALAGPSSNSHSGNGKFRRVHRRSGQAPRSHLRQNLKRCSDDPGVLTIDDAETTTLSYVGDGWTHSDYMTDEQAHHGTLSYSQSAGAGFNFTTPKGATSVTLYSSLKADRGTFNVHMDGKLVGNGTEHDASATEQTETKAIWSGNVTGKAEFHVVSTSDAWLAIDYVEVKGDGVNPEGSSTTAAPTPTSTPTSTPASSPTSTGSSSSGGSGSGSSSGGSGSSSSGGHGGGGGIPIIGSLINGGSATWFTQNGGTGACGQTQPDSYFLVAEQSQRYQSGGDCGKKIKVTNTATGAAVIAQVLDECPSCQGNPNSLDMSTAAFDAIGSASAGVLSIDWGFVADDTPLGPVS